MGLLPEEVVRASVAEEMMATRAWALRSGYELDFDEPALTLAVPMAGAATAVATPERYLLVGSLDDYRAIPPAWRFVHPETRADIGPAAYPLAGGRPQSSIFISAGPTGAVICVHFNRLAFAKHGGPHGDWGTETNWLNASSAPNTRAETIADMLARIASGVRETTDRMAPLP